MPTGTLLNFVRRITMAYKITRTQKITETLELTDSNGSVIDIIDIDIDADAVCTAFRKSRPKS